MICISKRHCEEMIDWLQQRLPNEACGLVAGVREGECVTVKKFYGMQNVDQRPDHFSMDFKEQFEVMKDIQKNSWMLLGTVHSHPVSPAVPSPEDKRLAYDGDLLYLICSFAKKEPVWNAFRILHQNEVIKEKIHYMEND